MPGYKVKGQAVMIAEFDKFICKAALWGNIGVAFNAAEPPAG